MFKLNLKNKKTFYGAIWCNLPQFGAINLPPIFTTEARRRRKSAKDLKSSAFVLAGRAATSWFKFSTLCLSVSVVHFPSLSVER
jgi:hypothetical protein